MIKRDLESQLHEYAKFPAVAILGPRQSGKTTLAQHVFPKHTFLSFESDEIRSYAINDPIRFLQKYENEHGLILDEFQYAPKFLQYIKVEIDAKKRPGYFVLTGSQNFLMNQAITQSLAGRIGIAHLFSLSIHELAQHKLLSNDVDDLLFKGGYPRLYDEHLEVTKFYPSYLHSYIQRDMRELGAIGDLNDFQKFLGLCAGRVGQLINFESLGRECGVTGKTVKKWLSILEASYIIFFLQPHHQHFNKRVANTPKLYFYDVGLLCSLLRMNSQDALTFSPYRGNLFECLIISDLYKQYCNLGLPPPLYYWRDKNGTYEVDCLIDRGVDRIPVEIKSGQTIGGDFFRGISYWSNLAKADPSHGYVVSGGDHDQPRSAGHVIGWKAAGLLAQQLKVV